MYYNISGTTPSTPSRISSYSYSKTSAMTMTQPRETTTETDTVGKTHFYNSSSFILVQVVFNCVAGLLDGWLD